MLTTIENDFVDFLAEKRKWPKERISNLLQELNQKFKFHESEYRDFCESNYEISALRYNYQDEKDLIEAYREHALLQLLRQLSYSRSKIKSQGWFKRLFRKNLKEKECLVQFMLKELNQDPVIVDYGCGLAYQSFDMASQNPNSKIYLIEIESVILDFSCYRLKRLGVVPQVIPVTKENIYPKLPRHNICIATEVMEHLVDPLQTYKNIFNSMDSGGLLYGNFSDHEDEPFHVSPKLGHLRERLNEEFDKIADFPMKNAC